MLQINQIQHNMNSVFEVLYKNGVLCWKSYNSHLYWQPAILIPNAWRSSQKLLLCATALLRLDSVSVFTRKVDCSDARFSEDRIGSDVR